MNSDANNTNPAVENEDLPEGEIDLKKLSKGQLKKLKEKQKKEKEDKEAAEKAAADKAAADAAAATKTNETSAAEENNAGEEEKDDDLGGVDTKGLTKGQLKKLKEKQKKEKEAAAAAATAKEDAKDDKKGGKKMNAAAKLAQERMAEIKRLEEERKKLEEEARLKEEEEERRQQEEERKLKEIEDAKRKEKEDKINKLKEEGKYKTKKEREREIAMLKRREELIASGQVPADHFEDAKKDEKPKSTAIRTKKNKPKKEEGGEKQEEANEKAAEGEGETAEKKEVDFDNWEAEAEEIKITPEADDWETFAEKPKEPEVKKTEKSKAKEESKESKKSEKAKEEPKKADKPAKEKEEVPKAEEKAKVATPVKEEAKKEAKKESTKGGATVEKATGAIIRSPIICILGHVDTGKTKLLDKMRNTNVQEGEAGGITQQIGATYFPEEKLREEVEKVKTFYDMELLVPGLLIIDTPGHESFSNLRSRGSGLCDIAVLVVDIMHGLEKQTLESIELLKFRKTPFVIALNKIDRLYGWKSKPNTSSYLSLKKQDKSTQLEFRDRYNGIMTELTEKGFNVALYYDNPDINNYVSIIPTSAITGEGISDLLSVAINLTQKWLKKKITLKAEFKCTVLEVKVIEGLGASIDVMLVDGQIKEGDKIVLAGYEGPIVTYVRALLTPHPMKEMRVKNEYIHHKQIYGAMGIKISANDLEKALAGSELYIARNEEEVEMYKEMVEDEIRKVKKSIKLVEEGVLVAASTLGSLEALLQFLKTSSIPVSNISIGPVSKAEVIKAMKPLQITEGEVKKEYATILAFDVKILPDAKDLAEQENVKIFTANIIYHLFDHFTAYIAELKEERKRNEGKLAVFPCILKPVAFFNMKDPIVMGLDVVEGQLRIGTPIAVVEKGKLRIGAVESMEKEHKPILVARPSDGSIAVKFKGDSTIMANRHFELKDRLVSIVSRESIDALKKYFRDEMSKADWELVKKLKTLFGVI